MVKTAQESRFWEPDVVMEKANRNVIYRPIHGRNVAEPLVTRRIYVPMNEYVEVVDPENDYQEVKEHSSSRYQVKIEESKRPGEGSFRRPASEGLECCSSAGFVKLQRINDLADHDGISLKDILEAASSHVSGSSDTDSVSTSIGTEPPQLKDQNGDFRSLDDCFVFRLVARFCCFWGSFFYKSNISLISIWSKLFMSAFKILMILVQCWDLSVFYRVSKFQRATLFGLGITNL